MSTEVMYALEEDNQKIQKQFGCMNGIFQLFDRRYLLGQRGHGIHHKRLLQGKNVTHNKASNKNKDQSPNNIIKQKHRESVESSRNSFSSSCSSLDCFKQVQTEPSSFCPSVVSEPTSPTSNTKHNLCVTDSMTRKPRVVLVKTVAKDRRKGPTMTHVDSPRLLEQHAKPVSYERRDLNLVKLKEMSVSDSRGVKLVKETSRLSYDDRESPYKLQSYANIKDYPRLSLDSQQSCIMHYANVLGQSPTREPKTKPPPSSVVARLMGLEVGLDVVKCESLKIKPCLEDEKILVSKAFTRIPLEPAPWKQEVKKRVNVKVKLRPDYACESVYGQTVKRLTQVKFRTSGKDLRALKNTLETMQRTKMKSDSKLITNPQKVNKVNPGRGYERNLTPTGTKATDRSKKQVSPSHTTDCLTAVGPRPQRSKIRKQSNGHLMVSSSKTWDRSCRDTRHIRNLSEQSDTFFLQSKSDANVGLQNEPGVDSKDRTRETKHKFAKRLMEYKLMAEQPSPVSVLDAFYTEDTPSPIKKKSYGFKDDEDSCFDKQEWIQGHDLISSTQQNQLTSGSNDEKLKNTKQHVHQIELQATINPHDSTNDDHIYIKEILLASGFLKNLDFATTIVHLHPTSSLINPELFNILEKTKNYTTKSEKIKRKLIFDTVNNILVQKLSRTDCHCPGQWTSKRSRKILDAKKLLEELCLEINNLHTNQNSQDWDDYSNEVPAVVFDIERLVFNDLITEIMNIAVSDQQYGLRFNRTTD